MKRETRYAKAMREMKELGARDAKAGYPITAFPGKQAGNAICRMFCDRSRAAYEMGYRTAKEETQ